MGFRRVFSHAASIFMERGIARLDTRELSSLAVEPLDASPGTVARLKAEELVGDALRGAGVQSLVGNSAALAQGSPMKGVRGRRVARADEARKAAESLVTQAFAAAGVAPAAGTESKMEETPAGGGAGAGKRDGPALPLPRTSSFGSLPSEAEPVIVSLFEIAKSELPAFNEREEEFNIRPVPFLEADGTPGSGTGLLCTRASDEHFIKTKGQEAFETQYTSKGLPTIWHWDHILPCRAYLRHCVLAVRKLGDDVEANFRRTTFLNDRRTTIGAYLDANPDIMEEEPPESVRERYSG